MTTWYFWLAAAIIIISVIASVLHTRRRLNKLGQGIDGITRTIRRIADGQTDKPAHSPDRVDPSLAGLQEAVMHLAENTRQDVSEVRRLERMRSQFLGNVSHELRTPIFSVQGFLETLMDGAVDDPGVRDDFLKKAHFNVMRLHTLLNDLIEISRIESGDMKMSMRFFDATEFLRSVVEELRPTAEMAGITLQLTVTGQDKKDALVFGDRDRLKQVAVNLIENAIKYNRPEGRVTVLAEYQPDQAVISVTDTGIGIPPEDIDRIFERFYRVSKDRSRAVGGSGLGLSIVKHIVEAHGSSMTVNSEPGQGTTFSFQLKR